MQTAGELHVFTADREEWVIAYSPEDARDVYCDHIGCAAVEDSAHAADWGTHASHWEPCPDDAIIKIAEECPEMHTAGNPCPKGCDDNFVVRYAKTCADWAAEKGRSHLASANW